MRYVSSAGNPAETPPGTHPFQTPGPFQAGAWDELLRAQEGIHAAGEAWVRGAPRPIGCTRKEQK